MAQPVAGAFTLKINGDTIYVTDGVLTPGGDEVAQVRAGRLNAGNRRTKTFPKFTGNVPRQAGVSLLFLAGLDQAEVTIEDDIGGVWQMFGASANAPTGEMSESDGMVKLELLGDDLLPVNE